MKYCEYNDYSVMNMKSFCHSKKVFLSMFIAFSEEFVEK